MITFAGDWGADDPGARVVLSVLALIAAVVILANGRRVTLRRILGICCAVIGLLILWAGWHLFLSHPIWFGQYLQYSKTAILLLAFEIAIVVGGVLTAATAKTSAVVKTLPSPRP